MPVGTSPFFILAWAVPKQFNVTLKSMKLIY
uniref:Uncharacterized protein n=1 Tax=Siphoviridae sp. ctXQ014 TaxID=2825542 RepID=A0A8S5PPQ5_9CAUD|nr:MAG TPA: hypothetical protein [Siphoviridae sp. ctXQ014]